MIRENRAGKGRENGVYLDIKSRGFCRFLEMVLSSSASTVKKEKMQIKRRGFINKRIEKQIEEFNKYLSLSCAHTTSS